MGFLNFCVGLLIKPHVQYEDPHAHISYVASRLLGLDRTALAQFHSLNGPFQWTDQRPHMPLSFVYRTGVGGCKFVRISATLGTGYSNNYHGPFQPITDLPVAKAQRVAAVLAQGTAHL
jgi:hypothetical protein